MSNLTETKTRLENKIKATLLIENSFGFVIARKIWLKEYGVKKVNNSYKTKVYAHYIPKGKRKVIGYRYEKAVIAKGWQDVQGAFNSTPQFEGEKVQEFNSFDDKSFDGCAKQLKDVLIKG